MLCTSTDYQSYNGVIRNKPNCCFSFMYFKKDNRENGATFFFTN